MDWAVADLDRLAPRQRRSLRRLLVGATAATGRPGTIELEPLVAAAPVRALPAAAYLHRIGGTVGRGLEGVAGVPDGVRNDLDGQRRHSAMRHLLLTGVMAQVGEAFDAEGLAWAVMKGPVVAALYPSDGDRTYGDLDLLVGRHQFPVAVRVLESIGYRHSIHDWAVTERQLVGQVGMSNGPAHIDLHWHLHFSREDRRPFSLRPEAMLERRRVVEVAGTIAPTLDRIDTVISLAFHAARSDGHRLVWLKDLERALRSEFDVDELIGRCRDFRCGPPVGLMLGRSRDLLGAEIPPDAVRALTPPGLRATDAVVRRLVHPVQLHDRPTITRAFTRSARTTLPASVAAVPARGVRWIQRRMAAPRDNETDDPLEKASYLAAVARSVD